MATDKTIDLSRALTASALRASARHVNSPRNTKHMNGRNRGQVRCCLFASEQLSDNVGDSLSKTSSSSFPSLKDPSLHGGLTSTRNRGETDNGTNHAWMYLRKETLFSPMVPHR